VSSKKITSFYQRILNCFANLYNGLNCLSVVVVMLNFVP